MDETKLRHFEGGGGSRSTIQQEKQPLRQSYAMKKDHGGSNFVKSANNSPNSSVDRKVCYKKVLKEIKS